MVKETTIKISRRGRNRLNNLKRGGQTFEQVIFTRPLITEILTERNLKALRKKSFIERNDIIQNALAKAQRRKTT